MSKPPYPPHQIYVCCMYSSNVLHQEPIATLWAPGYTNVQNCTRHWWTRSLSFCSIFVVSVCLGKRRQGRRDAEAAIIFLPLSTVITLLVLFFCRPGRLWPRSRNSSSPTWGPMASDPTLHLWRSSKADSSTPMVHKGDHHKQVNYLHSCEW